MWELPNDRCDFARKHGAHAVHTEKAGGIPYPRATNRASRVETRKRNTWPHSQPEVDDGESQGTPERLVHVLHRLQEGLRLCRPWNTVGDTEGYGSASTPDSVTENAVHQQRSDSQDGVWREWQTTSTLGKECDRDVSSPHYYSVSTQKNIIREALEEWESGISIVGRMVTNLRYADDTTLFAGTKEDLIELVERVRRASEKAGL